MHVAIIMDGNGRWAQKRSKPRRTGHEKGAEAAREVVTAALGMDIDTLTLYAFSSDNWGRPIGEVKHLMNLISVYLRTEVSKCVERSIALQVIGRRDRLSKSIIRRIEDAERQTAHGTNLDLRIAIDYSARQSILRAARHLDNSHSVDDYGEFCKALARAEHSKHPAPPVDLLIRTGGEKRLSDFLLWESAYAELHFVDCLWPDFTEQDLIAALDDLHKRVRRFGQVLPNSGAVTNLGFRRSGTTDG